MLYARLEKDKSQLRRSNAQAHCLANRRVKHVATHVKKENVFLLVKPSREGG